MLRTAQRSIDRWPKTARHLPCAWYPAQRGLATTRARQGIIHRLVFAALDDVQKDMAAGKRKLEVVRAPQVVMLAKDHPMVGRKLKNSKLGPIKEPTDWSQTDAYQGLMELLNRRFRILSPEEVRTAQLTKESKWMVESRQSDGFDESSVNNFAPQQPPPKSSGSENIETFASHENIEQEALASDQEAVETRGEKKYALTTEAPKSQESQDTTVSTSEAKTTVNYDAELARIFAESRRPPKNRTEPGADKKLPGVKWVKLAPENAHATDVGIGEAQAAEEPSEGESSVKLEETYQNALYLISLLPTNHTAKSKFMVGNKQGKQGKQGTSDPDQVYRQKDKLNRIGVREVIKLRSRAGLGEGGLLDMKLSGHRMRYIHIAGTKGKGSVANYITSILTSPVGLSAGKIGTYTSPHINTVRERIRIDGEMLSEEEFTKQFFRLWRLLRRNEPREQDLPKDLFIPNNTGLKGDNNKRASRPERKIAVRSASWKNLYATEEIRAASRMPFLFNFMTLLAFRVFCSMRVRTAVVECGIGAEYDTTNLVIPASDVSVGVVTAIDYEHTSMLGTSLAEIAWHKSGVFKPGASAVVVRPPISALTFDFMQAMAQGSCSLPKPLPSSSVSVEGRDNASEQGHSDETDADAVMGVIWGKAVIDRGVARFVDVPFDVGMPDASAPPDQVEVGGPVEKLNMAVASLAVNEHFHQLQLSRIKTAGTSTTTLESPDASSAPKELTEQTSIEEAQSSSDRPPYPVHLRRFSLSPRLSRGRWQDMIKPTHLAAMAFSKPLPGRREVYKSTHDQNTTMYLDGAHTLKSLHAVGQWFQDQVMAASTPDNQKLLSPNQTKSSTTTTLLPLVAIIFDQRDRDRDPVALLSALIEPLRSNGIIFKQDTLAFIGLIRPQEGSNERIEQMQRHFEAKYPWLRFKHFQHIDHATTSAAAVARKMAANNKNNNNDNNNSSSSSSSNNSGGDCGGITDEWWPRPVHVLFTGSFSLTSRCELRDSIPDLFNMSPTRSGSNTGDDLASRVEAAIARTPKAEPKISTRPTIMSSKT